MTDSKGTLPSFTPALVGPLPCLYCGQPGRDHTPAEAVDHFDRYVEGQP